ncbi:unnamed protein product [Allacma fusca]|uniref:RING-type E3 ubiquitin transferase (cysteine targeting) n=1 Tax=Allacma fusca TaxID=39272 RepID=A0A8J2KAK1_9HEXA|nr:unnamed protein product [Allacma fusca]
MESSTYCSRVTQLDSLILDQEFYNFVKNQVISILDKIQLSNWVQIFEPEFDLVVSTIIWKLTVGLQEGTIGQRLLGLKYPENTHRHTLLYIFSIVFPYLNSRIGSHLAKRDSPIVNMNFEGAKYTKRVNTFWKICQVVNFCVFLRDNKYLTLSHRFSGVRIIPSKQRLPFPPGDSYQIRELLWHQFSDFLMIVVPFINLHVFKRYWSMVRRYWSPDSNQRMRSGSFNATHRDDVVAKCCFCNQDAIIPQFKNKCSFCYYCLRANQLADKDFKCDKCTY